MKTAVLSSQIHVNITRSVTAVLFFGLSVFLLLVSSCSKVENRQELAVRMAEQEKPAAQVSENDRRVSQLKADIRRAEKSVEQTLKAVKDKGTYWRLLGIKYMDYEMWKEALKAFDEALAIYPDFAGIQYHRALCASQLALASPELSGRREYLAQAEAGYRRALAVDPRNTQSMYALAVLLVFELERPLEALPLLEDYLKIERSSIPARFLLARVYLQAGNAQAALDLYEHIEKNARESGDRDKAAELYRRVMGGNYGS